VVLGLDNMEQCPIGNTIHYENLRLLKIQNEDSHGCDVHEYYSTKPRTWLYIVVLLETRTWLTGGFELSPIER
jgi:hypothetical protein